MKIERLISFKNFDFLLTSFGGSFRFSGSFSLSPVLSPLGALCAVDINCDIYTKQKPRVNREEKLAFYRVIYRLYTCPLGDFGRILTLRAGDLTQHSIIQHVNKRDSLIRKQIEAQLTEMKLKIHNKIARSYAP